MEVKFILNLSAMKSQMVGHVTFVSSYLVTDTFQNIYNIFFPKRNISLWGTLSNFPHKHWFWKEEHWVRCYFRNLLAIVTKWAGSLNKVLKWRLGAFITENEVQVCNLSVFWITTSQHLRELWNICLLQVKRRSKLETCWLSGKWQWQSYHFFSCLILVSTNQVLSTHQSTELALDTHVQVRVNLNLFFAKNSNSETVWKEQRESWCT